MKENGKIIQQIVSSIEEKRKLLKTMKCEYLCKKKMARQERTVAYKKTGRV